MRWRLRRSRRTVHRLAVGGAWFFIVVSLLHVAWVVVAKWGDPSGTFKLYHTFADGRPYDAAGMTYTGTSGLVIAAGQILLVVAAAAASVLPYARTLKLRRIGHGVLVAWAAFWALSLLRLASIDHQADSIAQAAFLCALAGCTGYRAWRGWRPTRTAGGRGSGAGFDPPLVPRRIPPPPSPTRNAPPPAERRGARGLRAARRSAASALERVARFTRRQAGRLAPSDGGSGAR